MFGSHEVCNDIFYFTSCLMCVKLGQIVVHRIAKAQIFTFLNHLTANKNIIEEKVKVAQIWLNLL